MKLIFTTLFLGFFTLLYFKGTKFSFDPLNVCSVADQTYISKKENKFFIKAKIYSLKNKKTDKAILLLPPTGGENMLDVGYAYSLCKEGFKVFTLTHWTEERGSKDYTVDFKVHQRYMTRTQKAIDLILEQIKESKIGVLGTSSGAINFSVALGEKKVSDRVAAFYNIVGGAPLCNVIARAGESALSDVRKKRFKMFNFKNTQAYVKKICSIVSWKIPHSRPPGVSFSMVLASKDKTVPYDLQQNLKDWWKPTIYRIEPHGHLFVIVKTFLTQKSNVVEFFKKNLD